MSDADSLGAPSVLFSNASGLEGIERRVSWTTPNCSEGVRAPAHNDFSLGSLRTTLDEKLPMPLE